jgi:drug/metabolite transporter (DMT)-like permease
VLGGVVGLAKGLVILVGLTLAAGLTCLPRTDFWKQAMLSDSLQTMAQRVVAAPLAALVFVLEPVFAAVFANFFGTRFLLTLMRRSPARRPSQSHARAGDARHPPQ